MSAPDEPFDLAAERALVSLHWDYPPPPDCQVRGFHFHDPMLAALYVWAVEIAPMARAQGIDEDRIVELCAKWLITRRKYIEAGLVDRIRSVIDRAPGVPRSKAVKRILDAHRRRKALELVRKAEARLQYGLDPAEAVVDDLVRAADMISEAS
jgi:hypothetical protein